VRPERIAGALLALVGSVLLAVPALADDPTSSTALDGVSLRWGLTNESNNRAFAPGTYNFFSAGTVPDPGKGGTTLPRSQWHQAVGDVAVQKWDGTAWKAATWAGLSTDSSGAALGSPTAGTFSNHRFVFGAGTGTLDLAAGTAHVAWDGDVTVLYYSGMSFFSISDPVLDVAGGHGTLTATVSGYASSVDDPDSWAPVAATQVTLADLPSVTLDKDGLTTTPAYLGVAVSGVGQVAGGTSYGSFPQSFVDYMQRLGTAAFWLSSGASTDAFKVPLPLTVAFGSDDQPAEPTPTAAPTKKPLDNPVVPPPVTVTTTVTVTAAPAPVLRPVAPTVPAVPTASAPAVAGALPAATQLVAAPLTSAAPAEPESDATWLWWLGGGLLLAAAITLLVPVGRPRRP
jgi:Htaa protein